MKRDKRQKYHTAYLINIIIMCLISLASLGGILYMTFRGSRLTDLETERAMTAGRDTLLDQMEDDFREGRDPLSVIRSLYPDRVVIDDYGSYSFYTLEDVPRSSFGPGDFEKDEKGILSYVGTRYSQVKSGIDINQNTFSVDFDKMKEQGLDFVCIYAGRFNSRQEFLSDEISLDQMQRAEKAGMDIYPYVTLSARNAEAGESEGQELVSWLEKWKGHFSGEVGLQVVYPTKDPANEIARLGWTEGVLAVCRALQDAGYQPVVCADDKTFCGLLDLKQLGDYPKWLQEYGDYPYYPYEFRTWRYGASIMLEGVDGSIFLALRFER